MAFWSIVHRISHFSRTKNALEIQDFGGSFHQKCRFPHKKLVTLGKSNCKSPLTLKRKKGPTYNRIPSVLRFWNSLASFLLRAIRFTVIHSHCDSGKTAKVGHVFTKIVVLDNARFGFSLIKYAIQHCDCDFRTLY